MFCELDSHQWQALRARGEMKAYPTGERIFSEGDEADFIYFVDSGRVSVFIEKFNTRENIQTLGAGNWLGEMALHHNNRRTASAAALDETQVLRVAKEAFLELMAADTALAQKINGTLEKRSEELVLREKLIDLSGICTHDRHIGIKGDPSLRESALTRERYESIVDRMMPELVHSFGDLLINRCAFRLFIGFNNGEIRISTIHDPFGEEFHPASRLVDKGYVERHFPRIGYAEKSAVIRKVYATLQSLPSYNSLPPYLNRGFDKYFANWQPLDEEAILSLLASLPTLRSIPNFYVRNATITTIKDAVHLQFNCDGSHILSVDGYKRFLEENI